MVMEFESKPTFKSVILAGLFAAVLAQPPISKTSLIRATYTPTFMPMGI